ncbi:transmembrane protease serine 9-like [Ostrinia nubilalis]|uniref:transmembrane protease serine 9-like n=1 Tax=Ostrinia nubilalis TaxID=29057 RepID=UPI003082589A
MWSSAVVAVFAVSLYHAAAKIGSEQDTDESGNIDIDADDSSERVGAAVTQIVQHPYAASLLKNDSYVCSATVLNSYWLLTSSKCFDSDVISSYVTHKNLANFTVRTGSSYNNKGGSLSKIKMLINNFDMKVSAVKLVESLEFGSRVGPVRLPDTEDEVNLGYLAQIIAWTPSGHIRVVNTPLIEASLCEPYTRMLPGNYICSGGVQDPNRHFCRRDNGGAVVQNNTLVGISTFLHTCAIYTKVHAFPKVASFSRWVDSVIWDEENRPTTTSFTTTTVKPTTNATELPTQSQTFFADPRKYYVTLPFEPINVPLEPAEDNSVIPRMSLYESYLQSMARAKTSTTQSPKQREMEKRAWLRQFGRGMVAPSYARKYDAYDYN